MRTKVARLQELDWVRRDDRQSMLHRQRQRSGGAGGIARIARSLQFDVETSRERRLQPLGRKRRGLEPAGQQLRTHLSAARAGQRDQSTRARAAVFLEPLGAQLRPVAMLVLQEGPRQQGTQVEVAAVVLRQQRHAIRTVALGIVGNPDVAADDRLDAFAARRLVEAHGTEHVRAVGDRQRALAVGGGLAHRIVDPNDPVDHRELRMQA